MRYKQLILFTVLLTIVLADQTFSQRLIFHNYTMKDGLISDNVHSICQDSLGLIWIATEEGLSSFNSQQFNNYTTAEGLESNKIQYITADRFDKGAVWIVYDNGSLGKCSNGKFTSYNNLFPSSSTEVTTVYEDRDTILWCGTTDSLFAIKNNKLITFSIGEESGYVSSINEDASGNILVASSNGVIVYDKRSHTLLNANLLPRDLRKHINFIFTAKDNTQWYLSDTGVLIKLKNKVMSSVHLGAERSFRGIADKADQGFLFVYSDRGICKVNKRNISNFSWLTKEDGLVSGDVTCALYGKDGILWLGSNVDGLAKLVYPNLFEFEHNANCQSAAVDNNQHVWFETNSELKELWRDKNNTLHLLSHQSFVGNLLGASKFLFIKKDKLIIAFSTGLIREYLIKNSNPQSNLPSSLVETNSVDLSKQLKFTGLFRLFEDSRGYIWTSALDLGVIVLNNGRSRKPIKVLTDKTGLPDNSVRCIYEDSRGDFWFGGYAHGLGHISKDQILQYLRLPYDQSKATQKVLTEKDGLPNNDIRKISEDGKGNIIVGTRYGGIGIINNGTVRTVTKLNGLISNGVWDISIDNDDVKWIATQSGVQRLSKNWQPSSELSEEIPNIPFYSINSAKDFIFFSNANSVYVYEPGISSLFSPSAIYLTQVLVNGKQYDLNGSHTFTNDQDNFTFEFVGVDFKQSKRLYEYRMLNLDKKWQSLSNKNAVTYASLRPGKYVFQVKVINSDNITSVTPAEFRFEINSPFYLTWWFLTIVFFLVASIVLGIHNQRRKHRKEIEKIRTNIAEDLHDEIGSGLTKISILSEHALKENESRVLANQSDSDNDNPSIERVGKIARDLVDQMIDVIWSIDPKYDTLQDFIFNFKNYAYELCEAKNIQLDISTAGIENVKVNAMIKRNLQLISKEALNNALKYSGCSKIEYKLHVQNKTVKLIISDNGEGFSKDLVTRGHGLSNLEKHSGELAGKFSLNTSPGKGTTVNIEFPIRV